MATARVRTRGKAPRKPRHRHVTIKRGREVLTLQITSPEVSYSNLGGAWTQIPRPGQRALLRHVSPQLETMQLDVILRTTGGGHPGVALSTLREFSNSPTPLVVGYGPYESGRYWRLTDVSAHSVRRAEITNVITRATAQLTFTEHFADGYKRPSATKPKPKPAPKPGGHPAKHRYYIVRRHDTLSGIAAKFYGDASRWPEIAKANHIRHPNRIKPGQRLLIP